MFDADDIDPTMMCLMIQSILSEATMDTHERDFVLPYLYLPRKGNSPVVLARSSFVNYKGYRSAVSSFNDASQDGQRWSNVSSIDNFCFGRRTKTSRPPFHPSIAFYNRFNFLFCEFRMLVSVQVSNLSHQ
jgi:hypothetical protein